ncbi:MAG: PAS domain S-box protein [Bacteroidota bacterium]|nr:PAS domain S-box protein [Bacteroidota bacterium]
MYNKLLQRQLQKHLSNTSLPEELLPLLKVISDSYEHYESDRLILERSMELSSYEMIELNNTLRKETEELKKNEKFTQTIIDSSNDCIKVLDLEGRLLSMCKGGQQLMEIDDITVYLNKSWIDYWQDDDRIGAIEAIAKAKEGEVGSFLGYCKTAKGKSKWWEIYISPIKDVQGNIINLLATSRDITERKKTEEALQSSEKRFRSLIENNEDGISLKDAQLNIIYQSPSIDRMLGFKIEDRKINSELSYIHPDDLNEAKELFLKVLSNPSCSFPFRHRKLHKDGHYVWTEGTIVNMLNDTSVNAIVANYRDITNRMQTESSLAESENNYRGLFEKMLDGVYKSTNEGKFIEVNPAMVTMLGYDSKEELLSIDIKSELYFEKSDRDNAVVQDSTEGIAVFRLRKKDGSEIWVEDRGKYVSDENGKILYHEGFLRDVTKRMHTEFELKESQKETADYRKALDQSLIVAITDQKGIITYANDNFCNISKYSREELIGQDHRILNSGFHTAEFMKNLWTSINDGEVWKGELKNKAKDGTIYWVDSAIVPFLNEHGKPYQYLSIKVDITERKKAEVNILEKNSELQKTNSELDKFVYSVSHDLRAPLSSILGVIEIAQDDTADELMIEHLQMLKGNVKKLDGFISDILDYSRNSRMEVKKEEINFKELLNDIAQNLKYMGSNRRQIDIKINVNSNSPVYTDKSRLNIVLNNLISNAIRYQNSQIPNPFVDIKVDTSDTETGIIIRDNGIGIRKELHQKIFDMFYRISEESVGSGLGLYIVKEAVSKLNGNIEITSEPGEGSTFTIKIPNN